MNAAWYALPLAVAGSALAPAAVAGQSAHDRAATQTVIALGNEAWYSSPKLCVLSICLPIPSPFAATYPAGTLHIGAAAGSESARTYLALRRPLATTVGVTGGTLRLPLDTSPLDGSIAPDLAKVEACTTRTPIKAVDGATTKPPAVDCHGAAVSHIIGTPAVELDIDLGPIAHRLEQRGTSIALLPVLSLGSTFDVTVSTDNRPKGESSTPVLILDTVAKSAPTTSAPSPSPSSSTPATTGTDVGAPVAAPPIPMPAQASEAPGGAVPEPVIAPQALASPQRAHGFDYPAVFLVPLLVLAALLGFGRQLTRPLTRRS
jgi:hypothetical protein